MLTTQENKDRSSTPNDGKSKQNAPSSEEIPNAHAAGDGAAGRSKEAITEDDIQPKKDEGDKLNDNPAY